MAKPSPAQARVLKYLFDAEQAGQDRWLSISKGFNDLMNRAYFHIMGHSFDPPPGYTLDKVIKINPSITTTKVLINRGWINSPDGDGWRYYLSDAGREIAAKLTPEDLENKKSKKYTCTAADIVQALEAQIHRLNDTKGMAGAPYRIGFPELANTTNRIGQGRRIDFWAMVCWPSEDYAKYSYEIKISRSDFLHEIKNPEKRDFALSISNYYFFVVPAGMIKSDELPEEAGLIELHPGGKLRTLVGAPYRNCTYPLGWDMIAKLGRKFYKREQNQEQVPTG